MIRLDVKPISVNECWRGRRWKTDAYRMYEIATTFLLPRNIHLPEGKLFIKLEFGFSSKGSDVDNPVKPFLDILQKRFNFNDSRIYKLLSIKKIVPKGSEYIKFKIEGYEPQTEKV